MQVMPVIAQALVKFFPETKGAHQKIIWWKWMLATLAGWALALGLAAIFSVPCGGWHVFGPLIQLTGFWLVLLFTGMGLLSSVPQAWLLQRWGDTWYSWIIGTTLGALLGGVIAQATFSNSDVDWLSYPAFTAIPVALGQAAALWVILRKWFVILWIMVKILLLAPLVFSVWLYLGSLGLEVTKPLWAALGLTIMIGGPLGLFCGLLVQMFTKRSMNVLHHK